MTAAVSDLVATSPSSSVSEANALRRATIPEPAFWAFWASATFFALSFSAYFFLYSIYLVDLNFSENQIGRITAALTAGSVLGTLPAGFFARRYGIRSTLTVCIPIAAAISAARICLSGYDAQLLLGFGTGIFLCAWAVCLAPSVAALCSPKTRAFAFSALFASGIAIVGLGTLLASSAPRLIEALVPHIRISVMTARHATGLIACGTAAVSILPLQFLPLPKSAAAAPQPLSSIRPLLVRFLPAVALWAFASAAFAPFVTIYFTKRLGISVQRLGLLLCASQIAQAFGVLVGPVASRRFGLSRSMILAQFAAASALCFLAGSKNVVEAEALYWLYVACTCFSEPCLYSILMGAVPSEQRAAASAAHQLVSGISVVLSALITGSIIGSYGYSPAFALLALASAGTAALFYRLCRLRTTQPA